MTTNSEYEGFDYELKEVIEYLKKKEEICELKVEEFEAASKNSISEWEMKNYCTLPSDLKEFYANQNGLQIEWKFKLDGTTVLPLGRMKINNIKELTKVGSVLSREYNEPSIYDLEDLQAQTRPTQVSAKNLVKFNSINKDSDSTSSGSADGTDNTNGINKKEPVKINHVPRFEDSSRNYELDNCNGYGKVCLVYRKNKAGHMSSEQSVEIWYLDRSLEWHFLASSFKNYYRQMISHLGLPQWQMLFTEDGLPPLLYQWYVLFAPGRINIHEADWKRLDFLSILEPPNVSTGQSVDQQGGKKQTVQMAKFEPKKRIDFAKIFEEKSKSKLPVTSTNQVNLTDKGGNERVRPKTNVVKK